MRPVLIKKMTDHRTTKSIVNLGCWAVEGVGLGAGRTSFLEFALEATEDVGPSSKENAVVTPEKPQVRSSGQAQVLCLHRSWRSPGAWQSGWETWSFCAKIHCTPSWTPAASSQKIGCGGLGE